LISINIFLSLKGVSVYKSYWLTPFKQNLVEIYKFMRILIILLISFVFLNGCNFFLKKFYGIKTLSQFNLEVCNKFIKSIDFKGISHHEIFIDTSNFKDFYELSLSENLKKYLKQPIQILYFKNDSLISFHANCLAKGTLRKLDWNINGRFDHFPPLTALTSDSINITWTQIKNSFRIDNNLVDSQYQVIVCFFWTTMLEAISKDAISLVVENIVKFHFESKTFILLVNNDKSFINL
jgi:hypothetical protein